MLFVPLDERFATRGLWLNMAPIAAAAYSVETPPLSLICHRKTPANITALHQWVEDRAAAALAQHAEPSQPRRPHNSPPPPPPPPSAVLVASVDMLIYGGLIASRSSNDTEAAVLARVRWLAGLPRRFPGLRLYLSTTVMRIPAYNGDFEEPWYWALYGQDLYEYSFYSARYRALHNSSDAAQAQHYKGLVPAAVLDAFLWRRARNFNATALLLSLQQSAPEARAAALYVTLDDSGTYGINVEEADALRAQVARLGLGAEVRIYPGADEVGAALLARVASDDMPAPPAVALVWRAPNATGLVPNYENQAINLTVRAQLAAAGATVLEAAAGGADAYFLVSNFAAAPQLEASQQPPASSRPASDYAPLAAALAAANASGAVVALADVRYSNGGDLAAVAWLGQALAEARVDPARLAYAAWNTDGNTLGTAAANAVLLARFARQGAPGRAAAVAANRRFTLLRLIEDALYQASVRTALNTYVPAAGDSTTDLATDLPFYERYSLKPLRAGSAPWLPLLGLPASAALAQCFYPWNRTFEIGLVLNNGIE